MISARRSPGGILGDGMARRSNLSIAVWLSRQAIITLPAREGEGGLATRREIVDRVAGSAAVDERQIDAPLFRLEPAPQYERHAA